MPTILDQVADRAAKLLLRTGHVQSADDLNASFRRIEVDMGAVSWEPGAKVQFRTHGATFRTFTPFDWDGRTVSFLVHRHGGTGPAPAWADSLAPGAEVQAFGPRRSLHLTDLEAGPVLVGDETSFALAAAWAVHGTAPAAANLFEVTATAEARPVLAHLGVEPTHLVERSDDDAHQPELVRLALDALGRHPDAPVVLTGKAQTIRAVRGAIKEAGLSPTARVKAYWDPNRTGLD